MSNPYYNPEDFGLELIGTVDVGSSWEFWMIFVWRNAAGEFFYAKDAGCSCPSPGEDFGWDDLTKGTFHEVAAQVQSHAEQGDEDDRACGTALIERMRNG